MIRLTELLDEVAYDGNLGFHEMFLFYNKANDSQIDKLEDLIKRKKFKDAWKFVQQITGVKLKGKQFESNNSITGGLSDKMSLKDIANKHNVDIDELMKEYRMGIKVEMEHTDNPKIAAEIARDHLFEDPKYYTKLKSVEG
jgi:hypothetical protein